SAGGAPGARQLAAPAGHGWRGARHAPVPRACAAAGDPRRSLQAASCPKSPESRIPSVPCAQTRTPKACCESPDCVRALALQLIHRAGFRLLVLAQAEKSRAMPEALVFDVVDADLDHQFRLQGHGPALPARPPALAGWRAAGEALAADSGWSNRAITPLSGRARPT